MCQSRHPDQHLEPVSLIGHHLPPDPRDVISQLAMVIGAFTALAHEPHGDVMGGLDVVDLPKAC